jgi:hypothetical protein
MPQKLITVRRALDQWRSLSRSALATAELDLGDFARENFRPESAPGDIIPNRKSGLAGHRESAPRSCRGTASWRISRTFVIPHDSADHALREVFPELAQQAY